MSLRAIFPAKMSEMDNAAGQILAALENRLRDLEQEIGRLTSQAAVASQRSEQERYWSLAQELQRQARAVRREISLKLSLA